MTPIRTPLNLLFSISFFAFMACDTGPIPGFDSQDPEAERTADGGVGEVNDAGFDAGVDGGSDGGPGAPDAGTGTGGTPNPGPPSAGDFEAGATPGGFQDISYARELIEDGLVPQPESITPEGLFSEHDLALADPPPCNTVLCVGGAAALATGLDDGAQDFFVQLGLGSNIQLDSFTHEPLNLSVVVDVSGSMGGQMARVKDALKLLVDQLRAADRMSLVKFSSEAAVVEESALVGDGLAIKAAIDTLETEGSTNMEAGLSLGYQTIQPFEAPELSSRVIVLTDALPNVGGTGPDTFIGIAQDAADRGVGLTFLGFGTQFDPNLVEEIVHIRGANARFVTTAEGELEELFSDDFDFLVTPIAYDLNVSLLLAENTELKALYGIPAPEENSEGRLFEVKTVFLSKNKGAIVLRLDGANADLLTANNHYELGEAKIAFETVDGMHHEAVINLPLEVMAIDIDLILAPSAEMKRTTAVTNQYLAMEKVLTAFHATEDLFDLAAVEATLDQSIAMLEEANLLLDDENLTREVNLLTKLKENLGSTEEDIAPPNPEP
jgi:Ca-activated chloride channel family protein